MLFRSGIAGLFAGAKTETGKAIYASFPYDSGLATGGWGFWKFNSPLVLDSGAVGAIFKVPPSPASLSDGPGFALGLDIDQALAELQATDGTYTESALGFMTPPTDQDYAAVRNRGGKIMVYHGVSDPIFSVEDTERWYRGLLDQSGGAASRFARLYRVPGMGQIGRAHV